MRLLDRHHAQISQAAKVAAENAPAANCGIWRCTTPGRFSRGSAKRASPDPMRWSGVRLRPGEPRSLNRKSPDETLGGGQLAQSVLPGTARIDVPGFDAVNRKHPHQMPGDELRSIIRADEAWHAVLGDQSHQRVGHEPAVHPMLHFNRQAQSCELIGYRQNPQFPAVFGPVFHEVPRPGVVRMLDPARQPDTNPAPLAKTLGLKRQFVLTAEPANPLEIHLLSLAPQQCPQPTATASAARSSYSKMILPPISPAVASPPVHVRLRQLLNLGQNSNTSS